VTVSQDAGKRRAIRHRPRQRDAVRPAPSASASGPPSRPRRSAPWPPVLWGLSGRRRFCFSHLHAHGTAGASAHRGTTCTAPLGSRRGSMRARHRVRPCGGLPWPPRRTARSRDADAGTTHAAPATSARSRSSAAPRSSFPCTAGSARSSPRCSGTRVRCRRWARVSCLAVPLSYRLRHQPLADEALGLVRVVPRVGSPVVPLAPPREQAKLAAASPVAVRAGLPVLGGGRVGREERFALRALGFRFGVVRSVRARRIDGSAAGAALGVLTACAVVSAAMCMTLMPTARAAGLARSRGHRTAASPRRSRPSRRPPRGTLRHAPEDRAT